MDYRAESITGVVEPIGMATCAPAYETIIENGGSRLLSFSTCFEIENFGFRSTVARGPRRRRNVISADTTALVFFSKVSRAFRSPSTAGNVRIDKEAMVFVFVLIKRFAGHFFFATTNA